jgi:hypothetical protein
MTKTRGGETGDGDFSLRANHNAPTSIRELAGAWLIHNSVESGCFQQTPLFRNSSSRKP